LYVIATDLDTGIAPCSGVTATRTCRLLAVASTAVPILYKPVRIADHDYIDGSVRGNAKFDAATNVARR
jgi:predicted acylesterase/phospholipase RssA